MNLSKKYPQLANFLGAWFPDADLEGKADLDVVGDFASKTAHDQVLVIVDQATEVCKAMEVYWRDVSRESNRIFGSSSEASAWLAGIVDELKRSRCGTDTTSVNTH